MTKLQFRVLYRQFLFRMIDLELLSASAQGDIGRLLGQFAGLLVSFSFVLTFAALVFDRRLHPAVLQANLFRMEHFLISTTMLMVGLFAVLSWDSTFPDRQDVLVLSPLPIRARTLFLAKIAAAATALGVAVAAMHCLAGLCWPFHFVPNGGNVFRTLAAYWITMIAAGGFTFCTVLGIQGLAAQLLARRHFLRLSAFLQMAAFGGFIGMYFLEPSLVTPKDFIAPESQYALQWLPSYWFLGLFHQFNGSMDPSLSPLARRAWIGLGVAFGGTTSAYGLSYLRTLRKIVEEPDIAPGKGRVRWLPRFGNSLETAIVQFSIRTLSRSRQHRVMLAFFLGVGFGVVILVLKNCGPRIAHQEYLQRVPFLLSSIALMFLAVVGTRVVFTMPLALRANWIFRVTQVHSSRHYMRAIRRPLFALAVFPVGAASAAVFLSGWPLKHAVEHLLALGLMGSAIAYICLGGFQKIPFTCSYLPGRSYVHMAFLTALGLMLSVIRGAVFEAQALDEPRLYLFMVAAVFIAAIGARWRMVRLSNQDDAVVQFEELATPAVQGLGLSRDGVVPTDAVS